MEMNIQCDMTCKNLNQALIIGCLLNKIYNSGLIEWEKTFGDKNIGDLAIYRFK